MDKSSKNIPRKLTKKTIATWVISTFLTLILTLNNFKFKSKHFLQTKVCAMGTIGAPSYGIYQRTILSENTEQGKQRMNLINSLKI